MKPKANAKRSISVLGQLCKEIAPHLVAKVVRQVEARLGERDTARKLDVWSHTVSLVYCHSTNCLSLNDVCDGLSFHAYELNAIRNAVPPARSTLSRANRERSSEYIKGIYEAVVEDLKARRPKFFGRGERYRLPKRFNLVRAWVKDSAGNDKLLTYLLLRLKAWLTDWRKDFKHFFTLVKGVVWSMRNLAVPISCYGTAKRLPRADLCPSMPYLPGFEKLQFG